MTIRQRLGRRLRFLADRIDYEGSFRLMSVAQFTFEDGLGLVFRDDGRGCPMWYRNPDYDRAHDESGDLSYDHTWVASRRVHRLLPSPPG